MSSAVTFPMDFKENMLLEMVVTASLGHIHLCVHGAEIQYSSHRMGSGGYAVVMEEHIIQLSSLVCIGGRGERERILPFIPFSHIA